MKTLFFYLTLLAWTLNASASSYAQETIAPNKEIQGNEMNPSLSIILDFVGSYFSSLERMQFGGHATTANGLAVTGAELAASANIDPYFKFDLAFCLAHLELEEIYLTTLTLPDNFQLRAGKFLAKVGRHNVTHPHSWSFIFHPLANQYLFGAEGLDAPGLEISWLAPFPWYLEIIGAAQVGEAGAFGVKDISEGDISLVDFMYPLRLVQFIDFTDDLALQIGTNVVLGKSSLIPAEDYRSYAYGVDFFFKWRPLGWGQTGYTFVAWSTEAWIRDLETAPRFWRDAGGYSDLIFGLSKRWEAAIRGELWRRLRGDDLSEENQRALFGANAQRASGAISFLPSHFSRLRAQYTLEKIEQFPRNHIVLLQVEVSAGAHGAHAY